MRVICVDDEQPILENFKNRVSSFPQIQSLHLFADAKEALVWVREHPVDVAFLDIEMGGINGVDLAKMFKEIDRDIRIFFVTAYEQYALEKGCSYLRMDTNAVNQTARILYRHLGYEEIGIVPCVFNGIPDVQLVCLEKKLR